MKQKDDYDERGSKIVFGALSVAVFLLWLFVQNLDYADCVKLGLGC